MGNEKIKVKIYLSKLPYELLEKACKEIKAAQERELESKIG